MPSSRSAAAESDLGGILLLLEIQLFQVFSQLGAYVRALQREVDGGCDQAYFLACVVAAAFQDFAVNRLGLQQDFEAVYQALLASGAAAAATPVTVLPLTLQVDGVRLLKTTDSCDDALALSGRERGGELREHRRVARRAVPVDEQARCRRCE